MKDVAAAERCAQSMVLPVVVERGVNGALEPRLDKTKALVVLGRAGVVELSHVLAAMAELERRVSLLDIRF